MIFLKIVIWEVVKNVIGDIYIKLWMMNKMEKIRFRNLSTPLKIVVAGSWIMIGYGIILFLIGMIIGVMDLYYIPV